MLKARGKVKVNKTLIKKARIAIVRSEFNGEITKNLEEGCLKVLKETGFADDQIEKHSVPGALEIPVGASMIAEKGKVGAIIALGAVIKGETYHFEIVARESARGIMDVSLDFGIPVINGIICAFNIKQAKARSGDNNKNKGREAAIAAVLMINFANDI